MKKINIYWNQAVIGFWSFMIILIFYLTALDTSLEIPKWIKLLPPRATFFFTEMKDLITINRGSSSEHIAHTLEELIEMMKEVKSSSYYGDAIGDDLIWP